MSFKKAFHLLFVSFSLASLLLPLAVDARSYRSSSSDVYVRGYTRKDGTYVAPHYRSAPDGIVSNNYSCIDDGKCGAGSGYSGSSGNGGSSGSSDYSYTAPAISSTTCPVNSNWNGAECTCSTGYVKSRKTSACVTTNVWCMEKYGSQSYFNNNESVCSCSDGYLYDKGSDTCIAANGVCSQLLGLAQYDSIKKTCICNSGATYNEKLQKCILPIKTEELPTPSSPALEEESVCPEHSTLDSAMDLCFCNAGWKLNVSKNGCQKDVFVGYPKTRAQLLKCVAVGDAKKQVYYLQGHKALKTLALSQKYCFDDEDLAKKSGYKKTK